METVNKAMVRISQHAIEKYCQEIWKKKKIHCMTPEEAQKEIKGLFNESRVEQLNAGLLTRIMSNDFEETIYFKKGKWRFVICNNVMVTIEIDKFADTTLGYIKKKNLYAKRLRRRK